MPATRVLDLVEESHRTSRRVPNMLPKAIPMSPRLGMRMSTKVIVSIGLSPSSLYRKIRTLMQLQPHAFLQRANGRLHDPLQ